MPPIPSRTERDRIASLTTGVAPRLAAEPTVAEPTVAEPTVAEPTVTEPTVTEPTVTEPQSIDEELPVDEPPTEELLASEVFDAVSAAEAAVAKPAPKRRQNTKASVPPPTPAETSSRPDTGDGWPAPHRKPAPHADDWVLPAPAAVVDAAKVATSSQPGDTPGYEKTSEVVTPDPDAAPVPPSETWGEEASPPAAIQQARPVALSEPFKAPDVAPVPSVPEAGLVPALKYTLSFARARWQRRGAIGDLREQIRKDTGTLDGILGSLGRQTRALGLENKALEAENKAIDGAEARRKTAEHACSELSNRQAEENSKFADIEADKLGKAAEADRALDIAQTEMGALEVQRRDLRDQRKTIETRQKGYLKAADARDSESEKADDRDSRERLRSSAVTLRQDAEQLSAERQDLDRRYDALEPPIVQLSARVDALKSDRDAAKRSLTDLREGHRHRLAEIDAEQGRKSRELAQAEAEIERRFVTLGTLVNLNRIDRHEFAGMYEQIDTLRGAIGARSNEIDKLSAERQAYDKASLIRGACVFGGAVLLFLALLAILLTAL